MFMLFLCQCDFDVPGVDAAVDGVVVRRLGSRVWPVSVGVNSVWDRI